MRDRAILGFGDHANAKNHLGVPIEVQLTGLRVGQLEQHAHTVRRRVQRRRVGKDLAVGGEGRRGQLANELGSCYGFTLDHLQHDAVRTHDVIGGPDDGELPVNERVTAVVRIRRIALTNWSAAPSMSRNT